MAAIIISGIVVTISLMAAAFVLMPSFWFWAALELLANLLVACGCVGEWYLHHHPAGRAKREKDAHHKQEARYIFSVALGVGMEFFIVAHSIREGVKMEGTIVEAKERASIAERDASQANVRASSNEVLVAKIETTNLWLTKQIAELQPGNVPISSISATLSLWLWRPNRQERTVFDVRSFTNENGFVGIMKIVFSNGLDQGHSGRFFVADKLEVEYNDPEEFNKVSVQYRLSPRFWSHKIGFMSNQEILGAKAGLIDNIVAIDLELFVEKLPADTHANGTLTFLVNGSYPKEFGIDLPDAKFTNRITIIIPARTSLIPKQ